ncbi:hypothetical protein SCUP234_08817 [Seiridium cupressi]
MMGTLHISKGVHIIPRRAFVQARECLVNEEHRTEHNKPSYPFCHLCGPDLVGRTHPSLTWYHADTIPISASAFKPIETHRILAKYDPLQVFTSSVACIVENQPFDSGNQVEDMDAEGYRHRTLGSHNPADMLDNDPQSNTCSETANDSTGMIISTLKQYHSDSNKDDKQFGVIGDRRPRNTQPESQSSGVPNDSNRDRLHELSQRTMELRMQQAVERYLHPIQQADRHESNDVGQDPGQQALYLQVLHQQPFHQQELHHQVLHQPYPDQQYPGQQDFHQQYPGQQDVHQQYPGQQDVHQQVGWIQPYMSTCSPNYRGNAALADNQSANIPQWASSSVWITNLRLEANQTAYRELLFALRGCGKVYATVINAPDAVQGHLACAAKVVFFNDTGARELLRRAHTGEFIINNVWPRVVYNRIRTPSRPAGPESRVVNIIGPRSVVNVDTLMETFGRYFNFQTDEIFIVSEDVEEDGQREIEWRFASFRCQASAAMSVLERRRLAVPAAGLNEAWGQVYAYYGRDPCDQ